MIRFRILMALLMVSVCCTVLAQKRQDKPRFLHLPAVEVDGKHDEWPQLKEVTADTIWAYAVAYDDAHLYVAVRVVHPMLQVEAARNGILVNVNTEGKKREGVQLLFPIPDRETLRAMRNDPSLQPEKIREELIARSRGYQVKGFPIIVDGLLSFENLYGVHAKARISEDDHLLYEAVIPFEQLRFEPGRATPIAVQVLINNRWREMQRAIDAQISQQRRGMYGYGMPTYRPSVRTPFKGTTEVWIVDRL